MVIGLSIFGNVMKLSNLSLGAKMWLAMGMVIGLLLITVALTTQRSMTLTAQQDQVTSQNILRVAEISRWVGLEQMNLTRATAALASADPSVEMIYKERIATTQKEIVAIQQSLDQMALSAESSALRARIADEYRMVISSLERTESIKAGGNQEAAYIMVNTSLLPAADRYLKSLHELAALQLKGYESAQAEFAVQRQNNAWFAQGMGLILVLLLIAGTFVLIQQIRKPLRDAINVAETIANGDLTVRVEVDRGDEFGEMMRAIAHMQGQLVHLVSDVRKGTSNIEVASEEIASGNNDLSARTEQASSNLQMTASSMDALTSTVKQSAESARQANRLAESATHVAQRGGEVVNQVVATMNDINSSSRKISDIISVIDGIAFQTNILALNAAVEAARAGEQGRGFAVVASEVRSLAGRSADAAKEIKTLINNSVEKVEGGSQLVAQAGQTMSEIVSSVQRVTDIIGEITAASAEQAEGIAQVNSSVGELDQMTQQNAALVEQAAAASSSMREQAHRLAQVVSAFKLSASHQTQPAGKRAAVRSAKPSHSIAKPSESKRQGNAAKPLLSSAAHAKTASKEDNWESF
jgi:methyl-accepting chemotaxis protein